MARDLGHRNVVLAMFILSGDAGLVYEILCARQLVLVFCNTTQTVATILTGNLGGMAIGSLLGRRIAVQPSSPMRIYRVIELTLVWIVLVPPVFFRLHNDEVGGALGKRYSNRLLGAAATIRW
jgi:hypothetical protein